MNKTILALGFSALTISMTANSTEFNTQFSFEDMVQDDKKLSVEFTPELNSSAAVFNLDLIIQGHAVLSSKLKSVCTLWNEETCTGPKTDILHTELAHEVNYTLSCDDKVILNKFANNIEFTNEKLDSTKSTIHVKEAFVNIAKGECEVMTFSIRTIRGADIEEMVGSINITDSTSH
jgi:hypothetical protein